MRDILSYVNAGISRLVSTFVRDPEVHDILACVFEAELPSTCCDAKVNDHVLRGLILAPFYHVKDAFERLITVLNGDSDNLAVLYVDCLFFFSSICVSLGYELRKGIHQFCAWIL